MQFLAEVEQFLLLPFEQLGHGHAGPSAHDGRDLVFVHFFLHESAILIAVGLALRGVQLLLQFRERAVLQLRGAVEVVLPFGPLDVRLRLLDLLADRLKLLHALLLGLPLGFHGIRVGLGIGQFLLQLLEAILGSLVLFLAKGLALDLELHHAARHLIEFRGHRVDLGAHLGRGFVHQIDGLIGKEAIRDVAVGEYRGRHQCRVLDANAVMGFVAVLQTAQDRNRVFDRGLIDEHRLKPPFERGILLDVLAIFVQRGGPNAVQFAAREHRLEEVPGIHRAFGFAGPDDCVHLVDEEDDAAFGCRHVLQHGLEAFLEFAAELGTGDE